LIDAAQRSVMPWVFNAWISAAMSVCVIRGVERAETDFARRRPARFKWFEPSANTVLLRNRELLSSLVFERLISQRSCWADFSG
jgi:hypothetical protein